MKRFLASSIMLALMASSASAADIYQPQPEPYLDAPEIVVQQASSGWYLRGDVGYSFNKLRGAEYFQGSNSNLVDFDSASLRNGAIVGVGVGYQVTDYLRTDLTFDYLTSSKFRGSTVGGCGVLPAGPCTSTDRSTMRAYSLMANAYVDLGTYGSITPYVGAGIGGTYVKWNRLRNLSCADDGSGCDPETSHGGENSWRFTYALMAGASIDITCNVKADVGYRFRHVTGGDMFGYNLGGGPGRDKGFYNHEARVGARYVFGGCDTPVAYEPAPAPLVYK